jgi:hypothetical protein
VGRPPRSSANFISYDLRPAKQSERRILLELLQHAGACGLPISSYRYVGMGANRFYDFLLIHKYLGLTDMVSLEHDPQMFRRAQFNCPYGFIDVLPKSTATFLNEDTSEKSSVFWLDYDGGISTDVIEDLTALCGKLKVGDFCFVTVFGGPRGAMERQSDEERLAWFKDELGDVASQVTLPNVEKANFHEAIHKVLIAAFRNGCSYRREGKFVPLLQVDYADSKRMVTVGGGFLTDGQAVELKAKIKETLPFLPLASDALYSIWSLHLTERERALFDRAVTHRGGRSAERKKLLSLGFDKDDLAVYEDLVRYMPRYVETMI